MLCRQRPDFLPAAVVLGLQPGVPTSIPIVVVAEDGVTSLRYFITIIRAEAPAAPDADITANNSSSIGTDELISNGSSLLGAVANLTGLHVQTTTSSMGDSAQAAGDGSEDSSMKLTAGKPMREDPLPEGAFMGPPLCRQFLMSLGVKCFLACGK